MRISSIIVYQSQLKFLQILIIIIWFSKYWYVLFGSFFGCKIYSYFSFRPSKCNNIVFTYWHSASAVWSVVRDLRSLMMSLIFSLFSLLIILEFSGKYVSHTAPAWYELDPYHTHQHMKIKLAFHFIFTVCFFLYSFEASIEWTTIIIFLCELLLNDARL